MLRHVRHWWSASVFPEAFRLTQLVVCGLVGFFVPMLVEAAKIVLPGWLPESFASIPSYWLGVYAFGVTFLFSLFLADRYRTVRLRRLLTPRIEIVHGPGCLWCQEDLDGNRRILRIGLRNSGATTIDNISVGVELEPVVDALGLQLLHPAMPSNVAVALHPAASHRDHFNFLITVCDGAAPLQLERLNGPWILKDHKYTVTVVARGRDVVESHARFELAFDSARRPYLTPLLTIK